MLGAHVCPSGVFRYRRRLVDAHLFYSRRHRGPSGVSCKFKQHRNYDSTAITCRPSFAASPPPRLGLGGGHSLSDSRGLNSPSTTLRRTQTHP
ncbi:hypothetical protein E2C01_022423 [Portunus trituberculatus]|uniref:Uncharacterized protein n=1 Tax=Portunus trituberculatus TaxID=210409 RepID=A0A5B7E5B0_PORTR|nr:hypothetical protein [Portunus trituberculatus]